MTTPPGFNTSQISAGAALRFAQNVQHAEHGDGIKTGGREARIIEEVGAHIQAALQCIFAGLQLRLKAYALKAGFLGDLHEQADGAADIQNFSVCGNQFGDDIHGFLKIGDLQD